LFSYLLTCFISSRYENTSKVRKNE
jgi:hypothetical protein